MPFILDTGFFIVAREYYSEVFPSFWEKMNQAARTKCICSVSEVKREIENHGGKQEHLLAWIDEHESLFLHPSIYEQEFVKKIYRVAELRNSLNIQKKILKGHRFADPFVIAKAKIANGAVVTRELRAKADRTGKAQGIPKIPDVCQKFSVRCISPEEFMKEQRWVF